jgi:hypothetical protein
LLLNTIDNIKKDYRWVFGGGGVEPKALSAYNRSGLKDFGMVGTMYEVAQSRISGNLDEVKRMQVYEYMSVLSYLRSQDKLQKYARE